jgi:MtN3 and saliva related transmembrane protein
MSITASYQIAPNVSLDAIEIPGDSERQEDRVMPIVSWPTLVGIVAALCTTLAFLPQLFKIRHGKSELSSTMLGMYLGGLGLWLVYGVAIGAAPVIAANVASIAIVSAVTVRKAAGRRARGRLRLGARLSNPERAPSRRVAHTLRAKTLGFLPAKPAY